MPTVEPTPKQPRRASGSALAAVVATLLPVVGAALLLPHFLARGCVPPREAVAVKRDTVYCLYDAPLRGPLVAIEDVGGGTQCGSDPALIQAHADQLNETRAASLRLCFKRQESPFSYSIAFWEANLARLLP